MKIYFEDFLGGILILHQKSFCDTQQQKYTFKMEIYFENFQK